jgi:rare lipoprotein A (peptidoglycan hydrolase)
MFPPVRRVLPGMLASLLIAAPVLATHARAASPDAVTPTTATARTAGIEQRRGVAARPSRGLAKLAHYVRRRPVTHPAHIATQTVSVHTLAFFDDEGAWHQSGTASWYGGSRWQGQRTASGDRYEQDALTAAHATLPLGAKVRVTLDGSGREVVVTINDRPGSRTRIIDLSRGAARALGILDSGVARVTLSLL